MNVGEALLSTVNYDSLLKLGYAVIDVRYCDYEVTKETFKYVIIKVGSNRDSFYIDMLKQYYPGFHQDKDIYDLWSSILGHKIEMSRVLKRDVSIKVALYDFLESLNH